MNERPYWGALGYVRLAWSYPLSPFSFAYRKGRLRSRMSHVHLETLDLDGAICGARPGVQAVLAETDVEFEAHEHEIGSCLKCLAKAAKSIELKG